VIYVVDNLSDLQLMEWNYEWIIEKVFLLVKVSENEFSNQQAMFKECWRKQNAALRTVTWLIVLEAPKR